jgi:hypothetical protein
VSLYSFESVEQRILAAPLVMNCCGSLRFGICISVRRRAQKRLDADQAAGALQESRPSHGQRLGESGLFVRHRTFASGQWCFTRGVQHKFLRCSLVGLVVALSACASAQLNRNALDLTASLDNLTTKQIIYNLARTLEDPYSAPHRPALPPDRRRPAIICSRS